MRKLFNIILMATVLTLGWGCSSSDDEAPSSDKGIPTAQPPQWRVEFAMPKGTAGQPSWESQLVDFYQFENTMTAVLRLEDELSPFVGDGDMMAAIVNGEVREVGYIQHYDYEGGESFSQFMLLIPFAEKDEFADLYYYNAKTGQSYQLTTIELRADNTLGSEADFVVGLFGHGEVTAKLGSGVAFSHQDADQLALFVGDVCCGVGAYDATRQQWTVKVYRNLTSDTKAHFRYYSAERRAVYTTDALIDLANIRRSLVTPYYLQF